MVLTENEIDEAWITTRCVFWYYANRDFDEFTMWFFEGELVHPDYTSEWHQRWSKGFTTLFGGMDHRNQRRYVAEAVRVYRQDALKELEIIKAHGE